MATFDVVTCGESRLLAAIRPWSVIAFAFVLLIPACGSDRPRGATRPAPTTTHTADRVSLTGDARLDGRPANRPFIGAVVVYQGLVTPCNVTIPAIVAGRFALDVYNDTGSAGCGRPGARVVLWTYVGAQQLFAIKALDWPTSPTANVAVDFSTADPAGAAPHPFELSGEAHRADGSPVSVGTRVEAFVGATLCGVASVRSEPGFDGYILHVVGPDSIAGCRKGATITFRVGGTQANQRIRNGGTPPRQFDLTVP